MTTNANKKKAIGLFSGGLDSWLSALLIRRQDFDTYALHFVSPYFGYSEEKLKQIEKRLNDRGINLLVHKFGQDYIDNIVMKPKHGTGTAVNACVDCHRYMLQMAKKKMEEMGAEFVFSGEVLGQRPMSQRKEALNMVEKESGLRGYLVRPLSAKLLKPTTPEENGILNRELLMDISGRGRKRQMALARELGLKEYPQPAGGCKFTDINIIKRFNVMMDINKNLTWTDLEFLKFGRHFYLGDGYYFVTARDEAEVNLLYTYSKMGLIIEPKVIPGSTGLLVDYNDQAAEKSQTSFTTNDKYNEKLKMAGQIIARYTKDCQDGRELEMIYLKDGETILELTLSAINEIELNERRM